MLYRKIATITFTVIAFAYAFKAFAGDSESLAIKLALSEKYNESQKYIDTSQDPAFTMIAVEAIKILKSSSLPNIGEVRTFISKADWLPQELFLNKIERKLSFSSPHEYVIDWFTFREPTTNYGKLLLLHANLQRGFLDKNNKEDTKALKHYWMETNLDLPSEEVFLKKYKDILTVEDCLNKVERLTWEKNYGYAQKLLSILPIKFHDFAKSRIALSKASKSNARLLKSLVTSRKKDEFATYLYTSALLNENHTEEAIRILVSKEHTRFPASWWKLKNVAIRDSIRNKNYKVAYKLATQHGLPYGPEYAEAEWLAGWVALRFLHNYNDAITHFSTLYKSTKLANSKSKAAYWLARAYEASKDNNAARKWFGKASKYPGTFYGLVSIARVHGSQRVDYFEEYSPSLFDNNKDNYKRANNISAFLRLLEVNGGHSIASAVIQSLPSQKLTGLEYQYIANKLSTNQLYSLSVDIGKVAANADSVLLKESYPRHVNINAKQLPAALYLAIIRQESNFNQQAVSLAGARGLMQLMPSTAARMAKALGLRKDAYIHDAKSNILKGTTYFNGLYSQYNNIVLAIAAYNAGPGNVKKWISIYGDPREMKSESDVIDWIELIPFMETRNYVKKVLENFAVYNSMLSTKHNAKTIVAYLEK